MAPDSSTLALKIPWMEEPGGLQSMGLLRIGHNGNDLAAAAAAEPSGAVSVHLHPAPGFHAALLQVGTSPRRHYHAFPPGPSAWSTFPPLLHPEASGVSFGLPLWLGAEGLTCAVSLCLPLYLACNPTCLSSPFFSFQ